MCASGILGTKEYRKPEWVTHMEEMQEKLRGKHNTSDVDCMSNNVCNVVDASSHSSCVLNKSEFYSYSYASENSNNSNFAHLIITDYLNSHRKSITAAIESLDSKVSVNGLSNSELNATIEQKESEVSFSLHDCITLTPHDETDSHMYCNKYPTKQLSASCEHLSERVYIPPRLYHTLPRLHNDHGLHTNTLFPLEPRELDPTNYFQLHTADSEEELQEFLLLESQCCEDRGIAAAFSDMDKNVEGKAFSFNYNNNILHV